MVTDSEAVAAPLDERVGRLEHEVKGMKAIGLKTPQLVEMLAYSEAELRKPKEQQRKERPLPARLQSATHCPEKAEASRLAAGAAVAAAKAAIAEQVASLVVLEAVLVEADGKVQEAKTELGGVQQQCAVEALGQPDGMMHQSFQRTLQQLFTQQQADHLWGRMITEWSQVLGGPGLVQQAGGLQ